MVIQGTTDTGQISLQLLTTLTVLLLAAATLLISREKNLDMPAGDGSED